MTSTHTGPNSGTSSGTSSPTTKAGTLTTWTLVTLPPDTDASVVIVPTAVSILTSVTGSTIGTRPDSSIAVTVHIVLLPDIGVNPPCSITTTPKAEPGLTGGSTNTAHWPGYPRGSCRISRRRPSSSARQ